MAEVQEFGGGGGGEVVVLRSLLTLRRRNRWCVKEKTLPAV